MHRFPGVSDHPDPCRIARGTRTCAKLALLIPMDTGAGDRPPGLRADRPATRDSGTGADRAGHNDTTKALDRVTTA